MLQFLKTLLEEFDVTKLLYESFFSITVLEDICQLLQRVKVEISVDFARSGLVYSLGDFRLLLLYILF